jgi:hypothetical protein
VKFSNALAVLRTLPRPSSQTKFACATILAAGIGSALVLHFLPALLFLVVLAVPICCLIIAIWGIWGGLSEAWEARSDTRRAAGHAVVSAIVVLVSLLAFWPAIWTTNYVLDWATLLAVQGRMQELASNPPADGLERGILEEDIRYRLDRGPPIRVAYATDLGFLDNWSAIILDPTDSVAAAHGFRPGGGYTAPDSVKSLFTGDIVECSRMFGHYYRCSFT